MELLDYVVSAISISLSILDDLMPDFPVHGYISGQGWHVRIYLTPDLCHKLHTFGLLQRFGRPC